MGVRVRFLPSETSVRVDSGATLHDAVLRAGLPIASACGADGICGRCAVAVVEGAEHVPPQSLGEADVKSRNRVAAELRLACRAVPTDDVTITASYW